MKKLMLTFAVLFITVSSTHAIILEYAYKGDYENYLSHFDDNVSNDLLGESLFYNMNGCHAVTLQDGSVLLLVIDSSLGSIVYTIVNPDVTNNPEICGFGDYHGTGAGEFGIITDISADKWGNIAVAEAYTSPVYGQPPNDRIQIFRLINGEVVWVRSITSLGLSDPEGVCIAEMDNENSDADNVLMIADSRNDRIVISDLVGNLIGSYYQANGDGALDVPFDLEWQPDETQNSEIIYLVDSGKNRFVKLQGPLNNLSYQYEGVSPYCKVPQPYRLTLDQFGQLFLLDSYNARVEKYYDNGIDFELLSRTPGFGSRSIRSHHDQLCYPTGIAMAKGFPHIVVTEEYNNLSGGVMFINDLVITHNEPSSDMIDPSIGETTEIEFKLSEYAINYFVGVYNSQEQLVRTLDSQVGPVESGVRTITWNGKDDLNQVLPEGLYYVRVAGDDPYTIPGAVDIFATTPTNVEIEIRPETVEIVGNIQWNGTHTIYRNLHISAGSTLTLLPGTHLYCREGSSIQVDGALISNGTIEDPVWIGGQFPIGLFNLDSENYDRYRTFWQGIAITSSNPNASQFTNTIISGAQTGVYIHHISSLPSLVDLNSVRLQWCQFGLYCLGAFGVECNNLSVHNCETGIYLEGGSAVDFDQLTLQSNYLSGIYVHSSSLNIDEGNFDGNGSGVEFINAYFSSISNSQFSNNGEGNSFGSALYLSGSSPSFFNCNIDGSNGYGIYIANNSFPLFYNISNPPCGYNTIQNSGLAEMCYVGGMAHIESGHNNFIDNAGGVLIDSRNSVHFFDEEKVKCNYWGNGLGPSAGQLLPTGYFSYSPFDVFFNEVPNLLQKNNGGTNGLNSDMYDSLQTVFYSALAMECEHEFDGAKNIYRSIIENCPSSIYAVSSVNRLFTITETLSRARENRQEEMSDLRIYFESLQENLVGSNVSKSGKLVARSCLAIELQWNTLINQINYAINQAESPIDSLFEIVTRDAYNLERLGGPLLVNRINVNGLVNDSDFSEYIARLRRNSLISDSISAIKKINQIPNEFFLGNNYPNPFNSVTQFSFGLTEYSNVVINIYDTQGRLIDKLVNNEMDAGIHTVVWHPKNVSAGIYFLTVKAKKSEKTIKMLLLK